MDDEIQKEMKKFENLIDEEAARMLVLDRTVDFPLVKIRDLVCGPTSLLAKIESFGEPNTKVFSAVIGDETGFAIAKLWHHNVSCATYLREGDMIRIANAWVKIKDNIKEVHIGRYGMAKKIDHQIVTAISFGGEQGLFNIRGILQKKYPTSMYVDNIEHFSRRIVIDKKDVYMLQERARDVQSFNEGDGIVALWLKKKNGRIYADECSRILYPNQYTPY